MASKSGATSGLAFAIAPFTTMAAATTQARFKSVPSFFTRHAVLAEAPTSGISWLDEQIRHVLALRRDWDGYDADPISRVRLVQIAEVVREHFNRGMPTGSLVPGADGSVQIEWHLPKSSFGMSVEPSGAFYAWHRSREPSRYVDADGVDAVILLEASIAQALL